MRTIEDIGEALKRMRQETGLPITAVAEKVYYTSAQIGFMERSKKISLQSLMILIDFYGYEIDFVKKEK